ncbi:hypothetical protein ACFX13_023055 [Malus domestica]
MHATTNSESTSIISPSGSHPTHTPPSAATPASPPPHSSPSHSNSNLERSTPMTGPATTGKVRSRGRSKLSLKKKAFWRKNTVFLHRCRLR